MGRFSTIQIKFDKDYLNKLTEDPNSGVYKQNCKYHVALHPAQFTDFGQSIKDELGRKIARYDDIFQGIMLGYEKVKLESDLGVIGLDNLYIHIDIQADFFIFRPEIGMILKGVVTRTTQDHVGCLIYNTFNISLPKPDDVDENWLGNKASISNDVVFKIIFVNLKTRLPYIKGELISISEEEDTTLNSNKKRKRKISFTENSTEDLDIKEETFEDENNREEDTVTTSPSKKKHKKKLHKADETLEDSEIKQENLEDEEISEKSKKHKKKKKHKPDDDEQDEEILRKREQRKERKRKREENDLDVSLESLDIKSLFEDSSFSVNTHSSQAMANHEDIVVGKKRKKYM